MPGALGCAWSLLAACVELAEQARLAVMPSQGSGSGWMVNLVVQAFSSASMYASQLGHVALHGCLLSPGCAAGKYHHAVTDKLPSQDLSHAHSVAAGYPQQWDQP